jgi:peptidoglycan/xylan/chitin deacetylase (PgdA/CDA1 family)
LPAASSEARVQPNPVRNSRWWRSRLKAAAAAALAPSDRRPLLARNPTTPLILGYHRVVEDFDTSLRTEMPGMLTSRAMFERHIDCIGRWFKFVSLDDIAAHLAAGEPFAEPVAAVTFDDGYRDVYEHAFPVLKRKGIPGAVFVVTSLVGRPFWQIHDRLYRLVAKAYATWTDPREKFLGLLGDLHLPASKLLGHRGATGSPLATVSALLPDLSQADMRRLLNGLENTVGNGFGPAPPTLTWPMLAEMRRAGFVIGSHTETHVSLPAEPDTMLAQELETSKQELERRLGEPAEHFAYPGGQFTPRVVAALDRAGYKFAYTACTHDDRRFPHLTLQRLLLWERSSVDEDGRFSPNILNCQAHGLWPPARRCERVHHA